MSEIEALGSLVEKIGPMAATGLIVIWLMMRSPAKTHDPVSHQDFTDAQKLYLQEQVVRRIVGKE